MDFEMICAMISFAALVIVWAFAPTQPAAETKPVAAAVKTPA
jgi:hypothetical protein